MSGGRRERGRKRKNTGRKRKKERIKDGGGRKGRMI